jgi:hypothetical protein
MNPFTPHPTHTILALILTLPLTTTTQANSTPKTNPPVTFQQTANTAQLSNNHLTITFDLTRGGAISGITHSRTNRNLVNIADEGRYIQQSYYAGKSLDRKAEGQSPAWSPWSWNPIQVGDAFQHRAKILLSTNETGTYHSRCIPMLWDMNNKPAEAEMDQWTELRGNIIHVRNRLTCHRTNDPYGDNIESNQELPAVYPISALNNLYTYRGEKPFENAPLENPAVVNLASGFWGVYENVTEHWMAFVDDQKWGMGIYNPQCTSFLAGRSGQPGREATDGSTSYIAPVKKSRLLKNSTYEYEYDIIIGTLNDIRTAIYQLHTTKPATP